MADRVARAGREGDAPLSGHRRRRRPLRSAGQSSDGRRDGSTECTDHRRSGDRDRRSHDRSLHDAAGARRPRVRGRGRRTACSATAIARSRMRASSRPPARPRSPIRPGCTTFRRSAPGQSPCHSTPRHDARRTDARSMAPAADRGRACCERRSAAAGCCRRTSPCGVAAGVAPAAPCRLPSRTHRHRPGSRRARRRRRAAATNLREPSGIEPADRARRGVVRPRGSGVRALRERRRRVGVRQLLLSGSARFGEEPAHTCGRQPPAAERHDRSRSAVRAGSERPRSIRCSATRRCERSSRRRTARSSRDWSAAPRTGCGAISSATCRRATATAAVGRRISGI